MLQGQALKIFILFITSIKYVYNFEIFISKIKDENIKDFVPFYNQSCEIPLFQTRYVTIKIHPDDLRYDNNDVSNVIGFKFQIRSTNPEVVIIRKEIIMTTKTPVINDSNTVLLEDLYILSRKEALGHIFNAYPSPTLIDLDQNSANDRKIDTMWSVDGISMGVTNLTIRLDIFYDDDTSIQYLRSLNILVTQPKRRVDTMFYIIMPFMLIAISILMGILLDTTVIAGILKHPTPVLVGFVAQYGLMPFIAMAIAKIFRYTPLNSLALFVIGCCPGSGASNTWTVIFDGDVNLSAVMSFVSTAASFIMMPIYFYTFGTYYMKELSITVPFLGLARSLAIVVVPYGIGIIISHFFPKSRPVVQKLVKPMMVTLMLFFLTFGLVVNWYLFTMIDLYTALTAPLLPFIGFILGALLAWVFRLSWKHIKTIGIEAGIQNTGIAFMIVIYSFPQPYATQAMIVPMVVAMLTTKPFWVIYIIRKQVKAYQKRKELAKTPNIDGELIISNGNSSVNNKEGSGENMQKL